MTHCPWATTESMIAYHDHEWGVPVHDDHKLFEMLTLEGAQAGLSWQTILNKRDGYRRLFAGFDPVKVARYSPTKIDKLLQDPAIVRHRLKVESTIANARALLALQKSHGSFDAFIWQFVEHQPIVNHPKRMADLPSQTATSKAMSKALLKAGFRFVGPTICYAFMQATGMVNDHLITCPRHAALQQAE